MVTRLAVIVAMHAGMKRRGRAKNGSSRSIGVHTHIYIYLFGAKNGSSRSRGAHGMLCDEVRQGG